MINSSWSNRPGSIISTRTPDVTFQLYLRDMKLIAMFHPRCKATKLQSACDILIFSCQAKWPKTKPDYGSQMKGFLSDLCKVRNLDSWKVCNLDSWKVRNFDSWKVRNFDLCKIRTFDPCKVHNFRASSQRQWCVKSSQL